MQQEISLGTNIKAVLIDLSKLGLDDEPEISRRLGYSFNPFTKLKQPDYEGSTQLLSGLRLLKRVIELENQLPPKTDRELIFELTERVALIERGLKIAPYPPHRSQASVLNEAAGAVVSSASPELKPRELEQLREGLRILGVPVPPSSEPR